MRRESVLKQDSNLCVIKHRSCWIVLVLDTESQLPPGCYSVSNLDLNRISLKMLNYRNVFARIVATNGTTSPSEKSHVASNQTNCCLPWLNETEFQAWLVWSCFRFYMTNLSHRILEFPLKCRPSQALSEMFISVNNNWHCLYGLW